MIKLTKLKKTRMLANLENKLSNGMKLLENFNFTTE